MSQKITLGGERLGSGKKQKVELHGYERSTHDLSYLWRSTMSAGTLVPFLNEIALPGDTFDINLACEILTHPTIGPLFGSYKVQLDVFQAPIRLYQGQLHNNKLGIGMNMSAVKLPIMRLIATKKPADAIDNDNYQINPSCLLSYIGIRGVGFVAPGDTDTTGTRDFNALGILTYWDTYKQYYSNKMENIGAVIHADLVANTETVDTITVNGNAVTQIPPGGGTLVPANSNAPVEIAWTGTAPVLSQIIFQTSIGQMSAQNLANPYTIAGGNPITFQIRDLGNFVISNWSYQANGNTGIIPPTVTTFDLEQIDLMRENILAATLSTAAFNINADPLYPYRYLLDNTEGRTTYTQTQEGLGIKTYQSDLFNNWLSSEWMDDIATITNVDVSGGVLNLDALNIAKKVYNMLNRIAVSGGTYDDWLDVTYDHDRIQRAESPIYHGGLIRELVFQEVISNSANNPADSGQPAQPLGTLAGRGVMSQKKKGGHITIKVDEPSYLMGIISITPRLDNSQGNKWHTHLQTMDDFHKPALDQIGFQDLITEQMAWWSTSKNTGVNTYTQQSAGKQPAWINYMTNVNEVRGNFAIASNEMFMTLNRRYEQGIGATIADLTTYIDPMKFNHIFADTALDAQNFWTQIAVDMTARRKMSAKVMPNI